jgi:hypothetical protein
MHLPEAMTLLQKQQLLNDSIPLSYLAHAPPGGQTTMVRGIIMREIGGGQEGRGTCVLCDVVSDVCHPYPRHILGMVQVETSYGGVVH